MRLDVGKADVLRLVRSAGVTIRRAVATAAPPAAAAATGVAVGGPGGAAAGALAGSAVTVLVSRYAWDFVTGAAKKRQEQELDRAAHEAECLFDDIFRPLRAPTDIQPEPSARVRAGTHPDNRAAESALLPILGVTDPTTFQFTEELEIIGTGDLVLGDLVLLGGANSTPLTSVAWQFHGPNARQLRRPDQPILPLRFYGLSDVTDPTLVRDVRIGWSLEGVGRVATVNWPYIDTYKPGKRYRPEPDYRTGRQIGVHGERAYLPRSNYLLITRLPNFLVRDLQDLPEDPSIWPHLLMIEGNHGLGTRAVELLVQKPGLGALRDVPREVRSSHAFQVLFRVTDLELGKPGSEENLELEDAGWEEDLKLEEAKSEDATRSAFHRFRQIDLEASESMDHITAETYRCAHDHAWAVLGR